MKAVTFRFDEFDEAIDEAIEDDIKEADGGGTFLIFIFIAVVIRRLRPNLFWYEKQQI